MKDWDTLYENSRSREVDCCSFVCVPNKQDGLGFTRIMSERDGANIYGIFNLILGACSRQHRPRHGWLTDDGSETGNPWTIVDMAMWWRRPEPEIGRAMSVLCSSKVNWVEVVDNYEVATADVLPTKCRRSTLNGMEGNGRKEKNPPTPASGGAGRAAMHGTSPKGVAGESEKLEPPDPTTGNAVVPRSTSGRRTGDSVDEKLEPPNPKTTGLVAAPKRAGSRRTGDDVELPGFDRFWASYPRHERKVNRAGCRRKWARNGLESQTEEILAGLERRKASDAWRRGFVNMPMTFLEQRRWVEESGPAEQAGGVDASLGMAATVVPTPEEAEAILNDDGGEA